uniref:Uncharacterized protein n=1 Tax=Kalanchoe fedtschenkoi TaxID=63787 RepID=A0A7N0RGA0_KALFE
MESSEREPEEEPRMEAEAPPPDAREFSANGASMKTAEVEAKLDEGNIQEAESCLREGLSLNSEEARSLLGRLEYLRGNLESALRVFEGIDLQAAVQRLQVSTNETVSSSRRGRSRSELPQLVSQPAVCLVLEAIYLKAKSLQKLGRLEEAAGECQSVLDAVESIFLQGLAEMQVDSRLQETVSQAVELLPELWNQVGSYQEAMGAYRRALLSQWSISNECCARIQKKFACLLLYGGVEAPSPSLAFQMDGAYIPKNNLEEAILLLMILMRKCNLGKIKWDPSVVEHLTFALTVCGQTSVLARQLEEVMPGVFHRVERWKAMAICYCVAGENEVALSLLRKTLHKHEKPDDLVALLIAAKICSQDPLVAEEGAGYAQRAVAISQGPDEHLQSVGLRLLGLCLGKQSKVSSSDFERSRLQSEALKHLDQALSLAPDNEELIFEMAIQYAEHRNLNTALAYAKQYLDATGGSALKGWKLLALVLSAQQRFAEAEVVTDAAIDETSKWDQGSLLRLKAKLKIAQSLPMDAIEIYRYLLALVQAQLKSFGPAKTSSQMQDDKASEFEVWHGLATLYSSLSYWKDVEICLSKAEELKRNSAETLHTEGLMCERRGQFQEALAAYINALLLDPNFVPTKVLLGALLSNMGAVALPAARSILSDALRIEPTNRMAWFHLGVVHRKDGRNADSADCFQAASMLEESDPIESFSTVL